MWKFSLLVVTGCLAAFSAFAAATDDPTNTSHWFAFQPIRDNFRASILDCSRWVEAPTGKHGFLTVKGERFVFEDGTPVRFWGAQVNLWSKEQTDYAVRRMRRQGINVTRLHGLEFLNDRNGRTSFDYTTNGFDRLDYLVAKLGEHGIYLILDVHYPLTFRFKPGDNIPGLPEGGPAPYTQFFNEKAASIMHRRMADVFTHFNPYTKKRYCDDPTLALVEVLNEDSLFWGSVQPPFRAELEEKFTAWLRQKYGGDVTLRKAWDADGKLSLAQGEGLGPTQRVGLMRNPDFTERYFREHPEQRMRGQDQMRFCLELEENYWAASRDAMRRAGVRAPISASNWQGHGFPTRVHMLGQSKLDYIDRHGYWDHPQGEGNSKWRIATALFHNLPMVKAVRADQDTLMYLGVGNLVTEKAWEQVLGLPMTISEWNTCLPNEYSLEGTGLMAAYGLLQGWDGSLQFGYFSPDWRDVTGPGSFDMLANLPQILQYPAVSTMWHRQDVKEAELVAESLYDDESVFGWTDDRKPVPIAAALVGKVGYRFVRSRLDPGTRLTDHEPTPVPLQGSGASKASTDTSSPPGRGGGVAKSDARNRQPSLQDLSKYWDLQKLIAHSITGELTWDAGNGIVHINTPRTQAVIGFLAGNPHEFGQFSLRCQTRFGAIYVTAMDGMEPIRTARQILVTAVGPVRNTNMEYERTTQKSRLEGPYWRLKNAGTGPALLETVTGQLQIQSDHAERFKAWALDVVGKRIQQIPLGVEGDAVTLTLAPDNKAVYYELSFE